MVVRAGEVPSREKDAGSSVEVDGRASVEVDGMAERGKGVPGWIWWNDKSR
jgi:hypothetical protein